MNTIIKTISNQLPINELKSKAIETLDEVKGRIINSEELVKKSIIKTINNSMDKSFSDLAADSKVIDDSIKGWVIKECDSTSDTIFLDWFKKVEANLNSDYFDFGKQWICNLGSGFRIIITVDESGWEASLECKDFVIDKVLNQDSYAFAISILKKNVSKKLKII
jgi:hypothetical protein